MRLGHRYAGRGAVSVFAVSGVHGEGGVAIVELRQVEGARVREGEGGATSLHGIFIGVDSA